LAHIVVETVPDMVSVEQRINAALSFPTPSPSPLLSFADQEHVAWSVWGGSAEDVVL